MSADEDTELRDLVAATLEANGVLGKIKAELQASVFLALEEHDAGKSKIPLANRRLRDFLSTREGRLVTSLVREFLEFFDLDYSLVVFESEAGAAELYEERSDISRELDIVETEATAQKPLLMQLLPSADTPRQQDSMNGSGDVKPSRSKPDGMDEVRLSGKPANVQPKASLNHNQYENDEEKDEDSFFDEPLPIDDNILPLRSETKPDRKKTSHNNNDYLEYEDSYNSPSKKGGTKSASLRLDTDLDYDDDFDSEKISSVSKPKPDPVPAPPSRPLANDSPRSARSDSTVPSLEEEIDEELDFSANELLNSDPGGDDLTTDHTLSPRDQNKLFDYSEDVGHAY